MKKKKVQVELRILVDDSPLDGMVYTYTQSVRGDFSLPVSKIRQVNDKVTLSLFQLMEFFQRVRE